MKQQKRSYQSSNRPMLLHPTALLQTYNVSLEKPISLHIALQWKCCEVTAEFQVNYVHILQEAYTVLTRRLHNKTSVAQYQSEGHILISRLTLGFSTASQDICFPHVVARTTTSSSAKQTEQMHGKILPSSDEHGKTELIRFKLRWGITICRGKHNASPSKLLIMSQLKTSKEERPCLSQQSYCFILPFKCIMHQYGPTWLMKKLRPHWSTRKHTVRPKGRISCR